ncbi:MAG: hypothetical protein KJ697_03105 [Nanoarchaeota archaeon]|nr:hypothetical protein [Nanoarchaeota archaeon]
MNIKKFCDFFKIKHSIENDPSSLDDIYQFFERLRKSIESGEPNALIIGEYLFQNISSEKVRQRKSSATEFEDFLEFSLGGKVTDKDARKNIELSDISKIDDEIATYISSNRREKMDITFQSGYGVSLKTSVPENKEINMGSFAREALFKGFLTPREYGGERKGGLGSKPQIKSTFEKIQSKKTMWKKFSKGFETMVNNIYVDDMVFVIKGGTYLELYFIDSKILQKILTDAVEGGPSKSIGVINRYEGNSMRIERDKIIKHGKKVKLDFTSENFTKLRGIISHIRIIEQITLENIGNKKISEAEKALYSQIKLMLKDMESF